MNYIQQTITTGRYTLQLAIILAMCCWAGVYLFVPELPRETLHPLESLINGYLPEWGRRIFSLFCFLFIGYFLVQFNNNYLLIRRRASLQTSFFLLFVAACPLLHADYMAGLATILILFAIYNLFKCYQNPRPMSCVLNSFVFLSLASLLFPHLMLLFPVFVFGVSYIHHLGFRNFLAAIIGMGIPYYLFWSYAYLTDNMPLFYALFEQLTQFTPLSVESIHYPSWITSLYFLFVFSISAAFCVSNAHKDKISTRIYLRFLITLVFCLFFYMFLQPGQSAFLLPSVFVGVSILAAHYFVLTNSKASNLFFICTVLGLMFLFGYHIWMLS